MEIRISVVLALLFKLTFTIPTVCVTAAGFHIEDETDGILQEGNLSWMLG